jgi:hypothetical protein
MARGFSPLFFRRGLVFYRDLVRDLNRPSIGPALSAGGSPTVVPHPRIFYPSGPALVGRSNSPVAGPPYRVAAAGLHIPQSRAGGCFLPGAVAGGVFPHNLPATQEPC